MKNPAILIVVILLAGFLSCPSISVFACGGDGNQAEPQGTGIKSNSLPNTASSGVNTDPDYEKFINELEIKKYRWKLEYYERLESAGDTGFGAINLGVTGYSIYCWKVGQIAIFLPVSIVWQVSKYSSRMGYGLYTGRMETVYKLNKKTWKGRQINKNVKAAINHMANSYRNIRSEMAQQSSNSNSSPFEPQPVAPVE